MNSKLNALKGKLIMATMSLMLTTSATKSIAQDNNNPHPIHYENFGNTLNLGIGYIYSNNLDGSVPIFMANYEFNVAHDFTLAPFIGFAAYTSSSNYQYGNEYYYYRETIIPVGVKGTYYFDRLLNLNRRWDLYAAASLGYVYDNISWENGYNGGHDVNTSPLFLDLHVGAEYHFNRRVGLFVDLAAGNNSVSTIGLAFHHW